MGQLLAHLHSAIAVRTLCYFLTAEPIGCRGRAERVFSLRA